MSELDPLIYDRVKALSAEGDALAGASQFEAAIAKYNEAWALIPEPKGDWNASTWLLAAIGDACFLGGYNTSAREALEFAMQCPDAIGNPFLHLRLGQVLFEASDLDRSADELMRAYMEASDDIFANEDSKYLTFLATRAKLN